MYYRGAAAAILVYDITRASTFKTLQNWVDELRSKGPKDIALAIAGNKSDLEDSRVRNRVILLILQFSQYYCRRLIERRLLIMPSRLELSILKHLRKMTQMFKISSSN